MGNVVVQCPRCQRKYEVSDRRLGMQLDCECGARYEAYEASEDANAPTKGTYTLPQNDAPQELLQHCPACHGNVAREAPYCPHCGMPIRTSTPVPSVSNLLVFIIVFIGIAIAIGNHFANMQAMANEALSVMHQTFIQMRIISGYLIAIWVTIIAGLIRVGK